MVGHAFDEICLLTGLSSHLVRQHLDWYQRFAHKVTELAASE
jgi:hypothetical protein